MPVEAPPPPPPPPKSPPSSAMAQTNQTFITMEQGDGYLNKNKLLDDIRSGVKLKKCETIEKGLLINGHQAKTHNDQNGSVDTNNNGDSTKDPKMVSVQAELLKRLQRRNDGIDEEPTGNQILSPTLAAFVRNKDKPLRREETDDENSPKFISHGKRNFTIDRKCGVVKMNNLLEQLNKTDNKIVTSSPPSNGAATTHVLKPTVVIPEKKIEQEFVPPLPKSQQPSQNMLQDVSSDECSSSSVSNSQFTSPSPSPVPPNYINKTIETCDVTSKSISTSSSPVMFNRGNSLQTTPTSSESNLSEKGIEIPWQGTLKRMKSQNSTLPRKSEKLMMSHGKPNFVINKQAPCRQASSNEKPPATVSDEFAIKVQELRKNFDTPDSATAPVLNGTSSFLHHNSPLSPPMSPRPIRNWCGTPVPNNSHHPVNNKPQQNGYNTIQKSVSPTPASPKATAPIKSATLPIQKKHRSEITIPMANNLPPTAVAPSHDEPNYEKKVCVSFAKELSSAPNRYPDSALIKKQVSHLVMENQNAVFQELVAEDLLLKDIKFSIDPNRNDITIDLKIGVNLSSHK